MPWVEVEFPSELFLSGRGTGTEMPLAAQGLTTPSTWQGRGGPPTLPGPQAPSGAVLRGMPSRPRFWGNLNGSSTSSKQRMRTDLEPANFRVLESSCLCGQLRE